MKNNGITKKPRTVRNVESITAGALLLSLKQRVELRKLLTTSIDSEVKQLKELAGQAEALVNSGE